jgi:hypothetical protein
MFEPAVVYTGQLEGLTDLDSYKTISYLPTQDVSPRESAGIRMLSGGQPTGSDCRLDQHKSGETERSCEGTTVAEKSATKQIGHGQQRQATIGQTQRHPKPAVACHTSRRYR